MKIQGQTVLITGGCSGIGKIMGRMCLEKGAARLIIWDINEVAIERDSRFLGMPFSWHFIRLMQGLLPVRWIDFIFGDLCGLYTVMDHFTGRQKPVELPRNTKKAS